MPASGPPSHTGRSHDAGPRAALDAWRAELAASRRSPWLATIVLRHATAAARRAAALHARLAALPRRTRRRLARQWAMALPVAALALAWSGGAAEAATIHVGGGCTLVDAIHAANWDRDVGGCGAGSGADTVVLGGGTFDYASLPAGTATQNALLEISSPITLEGQGATISRSAGRESPFGLVQVAEEGRAVLRDVTLSGGLRDEGAGLGNRGRAELLRSTVETGEGAAIYNEGVLYVLESHVRNHAYGSGIRNEEAAHVTIVGSIIFGNSADGGGGIASRGYVRVEASHVVDNEVYGGGGGIYIETTGELVLRNSEVVGNRSLDSNGGGGIFLGATTQIGDRLVSPSARIEGSRIAGNEAYSRGGGLYGWPDTSVTVLDSTIEGNQAAWGGGMSSQGEVRIERTTISRNSVTGTGGGVHQSEGSMSIVGSRIEDNAAEGGGGISAAYGRSLEVVGTTIEGNSAMRGGGVRVHAQAIDLTDSYVLMNEADERGGGIQVGTEGEIGIEGGEIRGNRAPAGGGIDVLGTAELSGVRILENEATDYGGGILVGYDPASALVVDTTIVGNSAQSGGGGENLGVLSVVDSTVTGNAAGMGGGLVNEGLLSVRGSLFASNRAEDYGGGIASTGDARIWNSTFSRNTAGLGGGLAGSGGQRPALELRHVTLVGNTAAYQGAGLFGGARLFGSIISGSGEGDDCVGDGAFEGAGNLIDDHEGGACADLAGAAVTGLAPELGAHGGPTLSHALLPGSNAIDAVSDCVDLDGDPLAADQRGAPRPQDGDGDDDAACDIGAYERADNWALSVTIEGPGRGTVQGPAFLEEGIACGEGLDDCAESYANGMEVALEARPWPGWLAEWGGDCDDDGRVVMDADRACSLRFVADPTGGPIFLPATITE